MNLNTIRHNRHGPLALAAFLALAMTASAAVSAFGGTMDAVLNDNNIRASIEDEFLFDRAVPLNDIDVTVTDGIASLTGRVDNLLAKERATKVARTVKGVRSVVNRITVEPRVPRSDQAIRRDVLDALITDPATDSYEIGVAVADGKVTLSGKVDSWQEKMLSETVAKSVRGVTGLESDIDVVYGTNRSDPEIQAEIEKGLEWDVLVDDGLIDVGVQDSRVTLSGTVGSAAEKTRAISDAWVTGVTAVDAEKLDVARWARDDDLRQHKYVLRSDEQIRQAVEDALLRDPRVMSFDVATAVDGGVVTLRGDVDYLEAKRAAEQDARNTVGVLRVANRIKVRPVTMLIDADIRADVVDALARDAIVESYEVDVGVSSGRVTLSGDVGSYYEKFHAEDVAARVDGVVSVNNDIEVEDQVMGAYDPYVDPYYPFGYDWYRYDVPRRTFLSDAEIEEDVQDELFWSPFVDSDSVHVTVDHGVVTLTGTVDSWAEASAAVENAYEGGAAWVDNDLVIGSTS